MAQAEFDEAAAKVKNLQSLPSNEELLDLYGYFKQVRPSSGFNCLELHWCTTGCDVCEGSA